MESLELYNAYELKIKCKYKKELYDAMLNDCEVYLPPIKFADASYMRGVVSGQILVSSFLLMNVLSACGQEWC